MINKKLINFKTREEFLKSKDQIYDWSIVFIDDSREIWTHLTGFQSLPEGGEENQVLVKTENGFEWKDNTIVTEDGNTIPEMRIVESLDDVKFPLTIEDANKLYLPVGDYLTEHQDISNLATKDELSKAIEDSEAKIFGDGELADAFDTIQEIGEYLKDHDEVAEAINEAIAKKADKTELENYQPKGNYATKDEVNDAVSSSTNSGVGQYYIAGGSLFDYRKNLQIIQTTADLNLGSYTIKDSDGNINELHTKGNYKELHIIINNIGENPITVTIPNSIQSFGTGGGVTIFGTVPDTTLINVPIKNTVEISYILIVDPDTSLGSTKGDDKSVVFIKTSAPYPTNPFE